MKFNRLNFTVLFLITALTSIFTSNSFSSDSLKVIINEIAWMGTLASSTDEWFELYNNTDHEIDLTNWLLISEDENPNITLNGSIPAYGYFLLERTDENTISDITSDLIYSGSTGNSGEYFFLKDSCNNIIDEIDCTNQWFAGNNSLKISMERINPLKSGSDSSNWATNDSVTINGMDAGQNTIYGTPGRQNSVYNLTSITELDSPIIPADLKVISNFPNPFNPVTKIYYRLASSENSGFTSIKIYNLKGQIVSALVNRFQKQGNFTITWDGKDINGNETPSGIYIYRLIVNGRFIDSGKMTKLK